MARASELEATKGEATVAISSVTKTIVAQLSKASLAELRLFFGKASIPDDLSVRGFVRCSPSSDRNETLGWEKSSAAALDGPPVPHGRHMN